MMRKALLSIIAIMFSHSVAHAGICLEDESALAVMDYAFGNTVRITGAGDIVDIYFDCDGTFTAHSALNGNKFGRWRVDENRICTQTIGAEESCGPIQEGRKAGDSWEQQLDGGTLTVEVLRGR